MTEAKPHKILGLPATKLLTNCPDSAARCNDGLFFDHGDAAGVAFACERGVEPDADDFDGESGEDGALAYREDVGVVVFAGPASRLFVPAERAADAFDFVGDDGFAVAGAAEDDAAFEFAIGDGERDAANEDGIVHGIRAVRAEVADLMSPGGEERLQHFFVIEARVIGSNRNVHSH
jgi:hypothetical protein